MRSGTCGTVLVISILAAIAWPRPTLARNNVEQLKLENGLTVLLYPTQATDKIALMVLYAVGGDHDPPGRSGLAHLTEHLYVTAAAGKTPSRTVNSYMQRYPDGWNAQTGIDYTVFAAVFPKAKWEAELTDAAARMNDLTIEPADLEREVPRMHQELRNMFGGIPALASLNLARVKISPSAIGHRKGGVIDHIDRIKTKDVQNWWSKHYKPINATLVVAGNVDARKAAQQITKAFENINNGNRPAIANKLAKPRRGKLEVKTIQPVVQNAGSHATVAFRAPAQSDKDYAATLLLVSRMWMRAAMTGNSIQVMYSLLDDPTLIAVSSQVTAAEKPEEAIKRLRKFVDDAVSAPMLPHEKMATRNNLGMMLGLVDFPDMMIQNNLYGVAFSIGRCMQLKIDAEDLGKKLNSLTPDDLKSTARNIFGPDKQAAVAVRPSPQPETP